MLRPLGNADISAARLDEAETAGIAKPAPSVSARSAADSLRSSFTTVASASGLTPLSVNPTSTARVSRSSPVCSSCEISNSTSNVSSRGRAGSDIAVASR
eukprot:CAMPEP_0115831934 /NCGR_PEP_ID=MMETSP0287-20121206/2394_1 /TAXON_ID=412157 /ORGANISM="Chrysochromulina rotalis, Strain UIO044" /LENGTH=99 /DNA_ID=CAMNT_0003285295 /DNA_START=289 /DNA_END=584 /DNA_ORIENTATION=+